ncbi:MAG: hypothetical protein J0M15_01035 [Deltaproteobacteria bacterium]|nr:hypothetical protein [Deltaproteobacteria bacterium]
MKNKFYISLIGKIFLVLVELALGFNAYAEGIEKNFYTEGVLKTKECGYDEAKGKSNPANGINQQVLAKLNAYIREEEVEINGQKTKVKGSLTKNEDIEHLGERIFDFEKLQTDILDLKNKKMTDCLFLLHTVAMEEWRSYFQKLSNDFGCEIEATRKESFCSPNEKTLKIDCKVIESEVNDSMPGFSITKLDFSSDKSKKKNTCNKTESGKELFQTIVDGLGYLKETNNTFYDKVNTIIQSQMKEAIDKVGQAAGNSDQGKIDAKETGRNSPTKSEAGICADGKNCPSGTKNPTETKELAAEAEEKACCDNISKNWNSLGFSAIKGSKPSDRLCQDMFDKESKKDTLPLIQQCIRNLGASLMINGINSFLDFFSFGWITSIPMLLSELKEKPIETLTKVLQELVGWDSALMSCVNDSTKIELGCAMLGKFVGGNVGFGAAMGGMIKSGAVVGAKIGAKIATKSAGKFKAEGKLEAFRKGIAENQTAGKGLVAETLKGIKSGFKGGLTASHLPLTLPFKLVGFKIYNGKTALGIAGATTGAAINAVGGSTLKGVGGVMAKSSKPPIKSAGDTLKEVGQGRVEAAKESMKNLKDKNYEINKGLNEVKKVENEIREIQNQYFEKNKELQEFLESNAKPKDPKKTQIPENKPSFKNTKDALEYEKKARELKDLSNEINTKTVMAQKTLDDLFKGKKIEKINYIIEEQRKYIEDLKGQKSKDSNANSEKIDNLISDTQREIKKFEAEKTKLLEEQKEIQNQKKFKAVTTTGTIIGVSSQQAEKLKESSKSSKGKPKEVGDKVPGEIEAPKSQDGSGNQTPPPPPASAPAAVSPTAATPAVAPVEVPAVPAPSAAAKPPAKAPVTTSTVPKAKQGEVEIPPPPPPLSTNDDPGP